MYNDITKECTCNRCGYSWRSRGDAPKVCPKCTSKLWNDGSRKFEVIVSRSCGKDESGRSKFCIIPYIDRYDTDLTDDVFYISNEDEKIYLANKRHSGAVVWVGSFEIGEDLELKVHEMNLIYCHPVGIREYLSSINCLFNLGSSYQRKRAQKRREAEAERLAAIKAEKERQLLESARARIEEEAQKELQIEAAKRTISDEGATTEEKLRAVAFLEHAA